MLPVMYTVYQSSYARHVPESQLKDERRIESCEKEKREQNLTFIGMAKLQALSATLSLQAPLFATSRGNMRTDIIAKVKPNMTTIFGTQAWFLSSGCWK